MFQIIFGNTITQIENKKIITEINFSKKIFFNFGSTNKIKIIDKTKNTAAYFDKKDKPTNMPKRTKFIIVGSFLIFNRKKRDIDQKKTSRISVEIKKEETVAAGIR